MYLLQIETVPPGWKRQAYKTWKVKETSKAQEVNKTYNETQDSQGSSQGCTIRNNCCREAMTTGQITCISCQELQREH